MNDTPSTTRPSTLVLAIPYLLAAGFVVHVQRSFDGITAWNCVPVATGFSALVAGLRTRGAVAIGLYAFAISAPALVVLFHVAWLLDWHGTASGSSTSALAFIFVPFWACLFAVIFYAAAWTIWRVICRTIDDHAQRTRP